MDIVIDGKKEVFGPAPGTSMAAAMAQLKVQLTKAGRRIQSVLLEGAELDDERMKAVMWRPVEEFATLTVITRSVGGPDSRQTYLQELDRILAAVPRLMTDSVQAAVLFQRGEKSRGLDLLQKVSGSVDAIIRTVEAAAGASQIDLATFTVREQPIRQHMAALDRMLASARETVMSGQPMQIAHLVEYDLAPTVEVWQTAIQALRQRIAQGPGAAGRRTPGSGSGGAAAGGDAGRPPVRRI